LVNAWMRNLKGRKSADSDTFSNLLAMSVWWLHTKCKHKLCDMSLNQTYILSPFESDINTGYHG
jgi:hypothetical protein